MTRTCAGSLADRLVGVTTRSVAPDALAVRPVLVPVVATLADTSAFRRLFARAIAQRHRALRDGETRFAFELPVGEGVVFDTIDRFAPRLAAAIPPGLRVPVLRLDPREFELAGARALDDFSGWRWPLLLAALLAATGAALLAGGTRAALGAAGADRVRAPACSWRAPLPAWASSWWPTPRMRWT